MKPWSTSQKALSCKQWRSGAYTMISVPLSLPARPHTRVHAHCAISHTHTHTHTHRDTHTHTPHTHIHTPTTHTCVHTPPHQRPHTTPSLLGAPRWLMLPTHSLADTPCAWVVALCLERWLCLGRHMCLWEERGYPSRGLQLLPPPALCSSRSHTGSARSQVRQDP